MNSLALGEWGDEINAHETVGIQFIDWEYGPAKYNKRWKKWIEKNKGSLMDLSYQTERWPPEEGWTGVKIKSIWVFYETDSNYSFHFTQFS